MSRRRALLCVVLLLTALLGSTAASAVPDQRGGARHWVATWAAPPQSGGPAVSDQSFRLLVHTSAGGSSVRLRFSNRYGAEPVTFRNVTVGLPASSVAPDLQPGTQLGVRFPGGASLTVPVGVERRSLPLPFAVPADSWLAVSFHVPGTHASSTYHGLAWGLNWETAAGAGDRTTDEAGTSFVRPSTSWAYLTGLEVVAPKSISSIVVLGDSISDGAYSTPHGNARWPDLLDDRLAAAAADRRFSVVNAAINGNLVTGTQDGTPAYGEPAVTRVAWDVFDLPGVSTLVIAEGVNDIGQGVAPATIVAGYERILAEARRRGIRVLVSSVTPTLGPAGTTPAEFGVTRREVNAWIDRSAGRFDGVLRLSEAVQDVVTGDLWDPRYTVGDHTHPNPLGLQVMADSIPLEGFVN